MSSCSVQSLAETAGSGTSAARKSNPDRPALIVLRRSTPHAATRTINNRRSMIFVTAIVEFIVTGLIPIDVFTVFDSRRFGALIVTANSPPTRCFNF